MWKPALTASRTLLPSPISSRIRVKMMTFASTAIPTERMIPAIPGRVIVISNALIKQTVRLMYSASASEAARPGSQKIPNIITTIARNPTAPAFKLV